MEIVKLTEEQFDEKFKLQINHIVRAKQPSSVADEDICSFDGCMFETYGEELEYVKEMAKQNRVITILEGDDESDEQDYMNMFYTSGMHHVNRIGYLITTEPIDDNFEFEVKLD